MRVALPLLFLLVVVTVAACMPRHRMPVRGARLAVGEESFAEDGPFRVVFAGPKGEATSPSEITIAFSRPVRAAGVLENDPGARPPASVTRAHDGAKLEGSWRWFGGRTAVFWPTGAFANATAYRVVIDPSVHALDGSVLAPTEPFELVAPRPVLSHVAYGYDGDKDRHLVYVDFTQHVLPGEVARSLRIEGRGPKGIQKVPFTIAEDDTPIELRPEGRHALRVDPGAAALADLTVIAASTLIGAEGPLPSGEERRLAVPDLGPLKVQLSCAGYADPEEAPSTASPAAATSPTSQRCFLDDSNPGLVFNKGVDARDLARLLVLPNRRKDAPKADEGFVYSFDLGSAMELAPGRKYRLILKAGLRTADRQKLATDLVFELETKDNAAAIDFRDVTGNPIVESARAAVPFRFETMNLPRLEAVGAPLDDAHLIDALLGGRRSAAWVAALPGSTTQRLESAAVKNRPGRARFDLPPAMRAAGTSGTFAIATHADGLADDVRVVAVTDLGISSMWSPHRGLFWVTRLSTGKPVANANVSLRRAYRPETTAPAGPIASSEVYATTTDADGVATIPAQVTGAFLEPRAEAILMVRDGNDRTHTLLPRVGSSLSGAIGTVFMDRRIYRPGEAAFVKGFFRFPGRVRWPAISGWRCRTTSTARFGRRSRACSRIRGATAASGSGRARTRASPGSRSCP